VTASLGLALYPQDGADDAPLVHAADAALYRAKEGGRNCVVLSGDRMDAAALPDEYSWPKHSFGVRYFESAALLDVSCVTRPASR
jgi:hypothetical protein